MKGILLVVTLILTSCAHITPRNRYKNNTAEQVKQTPTQKINDFTYETQQIQLAKVIEQPEIKKNTKFLQADDQKKVQFWISYYGKKNKDQFERFSKNGEKYRVMIESIFAEYGLPKELYYVGIVESGYQNHARSHADAVGPWQFIKATAKRYGLKVNNTIDERRNIYKATEAAALYFQDLYNIFGSWELALAGYNAGEYGIIRRIRKARTRDYNILSKQKAIPKDTRHYIPQVIAVMTLDQNKNKYNLNYKSRPASPFNNTTSKKLYRSIGLRQLSKNLNVDYQTLKLLNPDLRRNMINAKSRRPIEIIIPKDNNVSFAGFTAPREMRNKPEQKTIVMTKNNSGQFHRVRKNESLYSIARRYNIKLSQIKTLNSIKNNKIYPGQKLRLPFKQYSQVNYSYIVKRGDNLSNLSESFKTSINKLKRLNRLKKSQLYVGQKLKMPPHRRHFYTIKKGDHLSKVSRLFGVSIQSIKKLNHIADHVFPGQKLIVKITPLITPQKG